MCWSPDSQFLASCSVDNTIRIWRIDAVAIRESYVSTPVAVLKEHRGFVKGIDWDPLGKVHNIIL